MNRADALGALSLLVYLPPLRWWRLDLVCVTCAGHMFTHPRCPLNVTFAYAELQGKEVVIEFSGDDDIWGRVVDTKIQIKGGHAALVLPFDPLVFREHLLHEVCPEWDHRLIGDPCRVQDVSEFKRVALL